MKKLSLILAVIILTTIIPVHALTLSDIETHWAKNNIDTLIEKGIVNGYPDGTFKPQGTVNSDAFIKMVVTALGYKLENGTDYWASTYIDKAIYLGIIKLGEITDYTKPIKRKDMALIISRSIQEAYPDSLKDYKILITDFYSIDDKYKDAVLKNLCKGVITGYPDKTFGGDREMTRAEASTVIIRLIDKNSRIVPTLPEEITDEDLGIYEDFELVEGFNPPEGFVEPHFRIVHITKEDGTYFGIEFVNWQDYKGTGKNYTRTTRCINYPQLNYIEGIGANGNIYGLDLSKKYSLGDIDTMNYKSNKEYIMWGLRTKWYTTFKNIESGFTIEPNMPVTLQITFSSEKYTQVYEHTTYVREMWKY